MTAPINNSGSPKLPTLRLAFGLLFICGILARLLGIVREVLIAGFFGATSGLDAVYLGLAIPLTLTVGIGSGFIKAVVPITAAITVERLVGFMRTACFRITTVLAVLSGMLALTSPIWTMALAWDDDQIPRNLLVGSAIFGCLAISSVGIAGILGGIANARGNHVSTSVSPLVYNAIVCLSLLVFGGWIGVLALPLGILLAEVSQIAVHWSCVRGMIAGARPEPALEELGMLGGKFWPAAIMGILAGMNYVVDRVFASMLAEGSVAALAYAYKLVSLPAGLLGMALAVPLYTRLSHFRASGNDAAFEKTLLLGLRLLIVSGLPIAALLYWTATPLLGLLLERGAFDERALGLTSVAFGGYAAGVSFLSASMLLTSASLTLARPRIVLWMIAGTCVVNFALDWILVRQFGIFGLSITTSIVAMLTTYMMVWAVAPGMLCSRELWVPTMRGVLLAAVIFMGCWQLHPHVVGLMEIVALDRIATVLVMTLAAGLIAALCWPLFLGREWRELAILRREVAGFVSGNGR